MLGSKPVKLTAHDHANAADVSRLKSSYNGSKIDRLSEALTAALQGREDHAEDFSLLAVRRHHQALVLWEDAATGESGTLGVLERYEVVPVVRVLYAQLRDWRQNEAEREPASRAKGASV